MIQLSLQFYNLTKATVNSHYKSKYFGKLNIQSDFSSILHEHRLQAAVQLLNIKFTKAIYKLGHKYKFEELINIEDDGSDKDIDTLASDIDQDKEGSEVDSTDSRPAPKVLCLSKALD